MSRQRRAVLAQGFVLHEGSMEAHTRFISGPPVALRHSTSSHPASLSCTFWWEEPLLGPRRGPPPLHPEPRPSQRGCHPPCGSHWFVPLACLSGLSCHWPGRWPLLRPRLSGPPSGSPSAAGGSGSPGVGCLSGGLSAESGGSRCSRSAGSSLSVFAGAGSASAPFAGPRGLGRSGPWAEGRGWAPPSEGRWSLSRPSVGGEGLPGGG